MADYGNFIDTGRVKTVNIKSDFPPKDIAVFDMWKEIEFARATGFIVLKVIHGYGSHGKGGEIKIAVRQSLEQAKRKGQITDYIRGEEYTDINPKVKELFEKCPELILDPDSKSINSGITLVVI